MTDAERPQDSDRTSSAAGTEHGAGGAVSAGASKVDLKLVRIAVLFIVTFLVLDGVLLWATNTPAFLEFRVATATVAGALISASGVPVTTSGIDIYCSTRILRIDADCTGLLVAVTYVALIVAYPVSWRTKGVGLLVGVPAILVANQIRLVAVAWASELLADQAFSFAHDYLFKVFMIAVVVGLWAWWLAYARRHARS